MPFLKSLSPGRLIIILAGIQILSLVGFPYFSSSAPPIDVVEGLIWAPHWLIGTYKHPPLPAWVIEIFVTLTRDVIFGPYLAAQLAVALTYFFLYRLGRLMMDPMRAAAGTALIAASYYFTVPTIEFNHNVIQLPLWAGTIFVYARIRREPSLFMNWILLGLICGIGLYAKYSFVLLIGVLLIASLIESSMRSVWASRGPYSAMMITLMLFSPHLIWLVTHDFEPFFYLADRADSPTASAPLWFLGAQLADHLPIIVPLLFVGFSSLKGAQASSADKQDRLFIWLVTFAPVFLTLLFAVITNSRIKDMWGMAMFTPLGLLIVMELGREWSIDMVRRAALTSCSLIVLVGIGFALHSHLIFGGATPRTNWPMRAIASEAQSAWKTSTSAPLAIIGGTPWIAGLAVVETPLRNSMIIGDTLDHSPWIAIDDVRAKGVLFLFSGDRQTAPTLCTGAVTRSTLAVQGPDKQPITAFVCLPSS
ncbi:MAG: glycosyltransferase family 39 protein [Alphaproteobacteria bacterium]